MPVDENCGAVAYDVGNRAPQLVTYALSRCRTQDARSDFSCPAAQGAPKVVPDCRSGYDEHGGHVIGGRIQGREASRMTSRRHCLECGSELLVLDQIFCDCPRTAATEQTDQLHMRPYVDLPERGADDEPPPPRKFFEHRGTENRKARSQAPASPVFYAPPVWPEAAASEPASAQRRPGQRVSPAVNGIGLPSPTGHRGHFMSTKVLAAVGLAATLVACLLTTQTLTRDSSASEDGSLSANDGYFSEPSQPTEEPPPTQKKPEDKPSPTPSREATAAPHTEPARGNAPRPVTPSRSASDDVEVLETSRERLLRQLDLNPREWQQPDSSWTSTMSDPARMPEPGPTGQRLPQSGADCDF